MTDNRANEPTAEQILVDEWIRQADRAKSMTGMDAIWFPDAEETLAVLRANGLLSDGTPSEEQARAIRKLDNVQAILAGAQASITDAVRELSLTSAALVAAGVAPQEPLGDPVFRAAAAIAETQARRQNLPPEVIQGVTREHMQDAKAALTAAGVAPQEPSQTETKSGNNFVSLDPEGRWEYRGRLQSCGYVAEGYISAEYAMNGLRVELEDHPYLAMDDTAIVERARVREWLPVEGEKP